MSDDARRFFDSVAGRYERAYGLPSEQSRARMTRVLTELPAAHAKVLDLGVGTGRELTALLDAGHDVTGVDVSPAMLERCARRARPVALVEADFWGPLPFPDRSFEAAIALHGTLAHPPDDDAISGLARELARVMRPGSPWIIEVPSPAWLEAPPDERVRRTGPTTAIYEDAVTGARIATRLLSAEEWTAALGPAWTIRVETRANAEWLVLARLAR
jgi:ubiquinone/menaquinone biosynthesis C-methylase UbiE